MDTKENKYIYDKEYYKKNKKKLNKYYKKYYEKNKEKIMTKRRETRKKNKNKIEKCKSQNNSEKIKQIISSIKPFENNNYVHICKMNEYKFCNTCAMKVYSEVMLELSSSNMPSVQEHFENLAKICGTSRRHKKID